MKKIAIFVEGQTEQLFVEKMVYQFYNRGEVYIDKIKLWGKSNHKPLPQREDISYYKYYFLLVDSGNDTKVLSDLLARMENLFENNFEKILGLRDLYPQKREEKPFVIEMIQLALSKKAAPLDKIKIILAIMETEAWFLGDPHLFQRIDSTLSPEFIQKKLEYNLIEDDPETVYNHPAKIIQEIYKLVGRDYGKHEDEVKEITAALDYDYLCVKVKDQGKILSFFRFLDEIENL